MRIESLSEVFFWELNKPFVDHEGAVVECDAAVVVEKLIFVDVRGYYGQADVHVLFNKLLEGKRGNVIFK